MNYRIIIDVEAQADIDRFYRYLKRFDKGVAVKYVNAFYDVIERNLASAPHMFSHFSETGPPYRALLFSISSRTTYWIIYKIEEDRNEVQILRFWNTARKPGSHGLL